MRLRVVHYLQKLALTFWLGEMLFFALIFAPRVFKVLPREMAGQLQNAIFPGYFTVGLSCGLLLLLSTFVRRHAYSVPRLRLNLSLLLGITLIFGYCLWVLTPQLRELLPLVHAGERTEDFRILHRVSVQLNGITLLVLLSLLALL